MAFKKRTAIAVRRPVTASPKYIALQARVSNLAKRSRAAAGANEGTLLVLAGAAAPALIQRFTGKALPTVAGIDPGILWGAALMGVGMYVKGRNGDRLKQLGTGVAAPAVARAITTGTIKVSGEDDVSGDGDEVGDVEIGDEAI